MKNPKFIFMLFFSLFGVHCISLQSQENSTITFKQFIQLLEQKDKDKNVQIADSIYLQYINDMPQSDDESKKEVNILLKRDGFVGVIIYNSFDYGREDVSKLYIYDWQGILITEFDFASGTYGDYASESNVCKLKDDDILECKYAINLGGLEEVHDEEGNIIGMNYVTVKDEASFEYFRILNDGKIEKIEPEIDGD